jgi:sugar porter (SP) family MFS transporter
MDNFVKDWCDHDLRELCSGPIESQPESWLNFQQTFVALLNAGAMAGAICASFFSDKLGRRATIFIGACTFCIGTLMQMLVPSFSYTTLYVSRFVDGFGIGTSSFILPLYAAEVAPCHLRGLMSGLMQLTVCAGVVGAGLANLAFENMEDGWRYSTSVALLPAVVVMCSALFVPESPRWLLQHRSEGAARQALQRLRQHEGVQDELDEIVQAAAALSDGGGAGRATVTWADLLCGKYLGRTAVACMLMVWQQLTGVNPVLTYGGVIVNGFGMAPILALVAIQGTNFAATVLLFALNGLDRIGRRRLLFIGAGGMAASLWSASMMLLAYCEAELEEGAAGGGAGGCASMPEGVQVAVVVALCCFIFSFAVSFGPVCWVYPPELFPTHMRSKAVSLSTCTNWAAGFAMSYSLGLFQRWGVPWTFFAFGCCCACAPPFVYYQCPETAQRTLEQVSFVFRQRDDRDPSATAVGVGAGRSGAGQGQGGGRGLGAGLIADPARGGSSGSEGSWVSVR